MLRIDSEACSECFFFRHEGKYPNLKYRCTNPNLPEDTYTGLNWTPRQALEAAGLNTLIKDMEGLNSTCRRPAPRFRLNLTPEEIVEWIHDMRDPSNYEDQG